MASMAARFDHSVPLATNPAYPGPGVCPHPAGGRLPPIVHQHPSPVSGTSHESALRLDSKIVFTQNGRTEKRILSDGCSRQRSQNGGMIPQGRSEYRTNARRRESLRSGDGGERFSASYTASVCSYESEGSSGSDAANSSGNS